MTTTRSLAPDSMTQDTIALLLPEAELEAIQQLPELWNDLTPQQQTQVASLTQQLHETLNQLVTVIEEAERQAQIKRNQGLITLLDSWATADEAEVTDQRETLEYLKRALAEDRP